MPMRKCRVAKMALEVEVDVRKVEVATGVEKMEAPAVKVEVKVKAGLDEAETGSEEMKLPVSSSQPDGAQCRAARQ